MEKMKKVVLVTGGQRSGKSTYAEKLALQLSGKSQAVYMATAKIWDEEFERRVQIHKERRGPQWINIEEEKYLSRHNVEGRVVLIDCVTLWSTNFFFEQSMEDNLPCSGNPNFTMDAGQAKESASLVEQTLQQIASQTGGRYFRATDRQKLKEIYDEINTLEKSEVEITDLTIYHEQFVALLLLAIGLLVAEMLLEKLVLKRIP